MRKRTLISLILAVAMVCAIPGVALADSWQYYFPITVSDNSGATRTAYPIILEVGGQSLVDGGYLTANGTDARLRTTADKNLLMSTTNITFTLDSLPAYGQVTYDLYTGYSPEIGAFQIIVGDGGYVTVADNTTIELGDNFTVEQGGWVDTTAGDNKTLVSKPQAFRTYVSPVVSGNITAAISAGAATSANLTTNGAGDETGVFTLVGDTQWEAVQTNDGNTSYIATPNSTYVESSFNLSPFIPTSGNISSVTVTFTIRMDDPGTGYATPKLRLGGVDSDGTEQSKADQSFASFTQTITKPGGGSWADYDLADLQVGIQLKGTGSVNIRCTYLTVTVNYTPEISVTASGVSSGEHIIQVSEGSAITQESLEAGDDASVGTGGANWYTQTFTSSTDFVIGAVELFGGKSNSPGDMTIGIRLTSGGEPIGDDLISVTLAEGDMPAPNDWSALNFATPCAGTGGVMYAIVTRCPSGGGANTYGWRRDSSSPPYAGGTFVWSDDSGSTWNVDATNDMLFKIITHSGLEIWVDGVLEDGAGNDYNASVPDNANDWVFYQNNVLPYADNTTIWVGGVRQLWFEPNEMITGTILPDRETATANTGNITWGANDQVTVTFGSVTSYEATTSAATTNVTGFVLPLVGIPDNWWGMEFDGEDLPFYPTFLDTSTQTGIPLQTLYLFVVFGVAIALATVTIVLTRSVLVGVAFYTVTMAYGANAGIVAWWIIYVFLIMIIGIIFLSSRQAMGG